MKQANNKEYANTPIENGDVFTKVHGTNTYTCTVVDKDWNKIDETAVGRFEVSMTDCGSVFDRFSGIIPHMVLRHNYKRKK